MREEDSELAFALLNGATTSRITLASPPILRGEVLNAVYQRTRRRTLGDPIGLDVARQALDEFLIFAPQVSEPDGLYERALEIAHDSGLSATYDAVYVALAEVLDATLWTADGALLRSIGGTYPFARALSDYPI